MRGVDWIGSAARRLAFVLWPTGSVRCGCLLSGRSFRNPGTSGSRWIPTSTFPSWSAQADHDELSERVRTGPSRFSSIVTIGRSRESRGLWFARAFGAFVFAAALTLAGCQTTGDNAKLSLESGPKPIAKAGLDALKEGRLKDAQTAFNAALKLDLRSSTLQFLNGLTYHLRALKEDRSLFPMAAQGYQLAIQFDNTNWMARYHLGLLHLDQRDYAQARTALADAMLYNDSDPELLYNLAVAAYYAQDPVTAAGALTRLRQVEPESARALRASSLTLAALGKPNDARAMLARYVALEPAADKARFVARRVEDWQQFHARVQTASLRPPIAPASADASGAQLAQAPDPFGAAPNPFGAPAPSPFPDPNQPQPFGAPVTPVDPGQPAPNAQAPFGIPPADPNAPPGAPPPLDPSERMVIVDVVIVSSEEDITTAKGVNLLNGLQLQFGTSSLPAFQRSVTINSGDGTIAGSPVSSGQLTTITRAITIPAITYSLNIANAGTTRNEILARPTLVATSGQKSEFFSGSNIRAAAVATVAGSAPTGSIDVDKDIGVKLGITPQFLNGDRVRLLVEAERTFLQDTTASVNFQFQLRTSKTNVNANVVLNLGETLILSGLSEKETANVRSGVPGLQDIPVVQYLFSRQTTRDFNKSVLILITPRTAEYTYRPRHVREREQARLPPDQRILSELQARYADWFRPYPNWASVFHHLQENSLYREFRTGDVALERWETFTDIENRLKKLPEFLYF